MLCLRNGNRVYAEEFPWASTQEGGSSAYVFPATRDEQNVVRGQGSAILTGYRNSGVGFNDYFKITFTPASIFHSLFGQYCTALHANPQDTSICGKEPAQTLFGTGGVNIANFAYQVVSSGAIPFAFMHVAGTNKGKVTKRQQDFDVADILAAAEDTKAE
ncbi:hypothetical protein F66182_16867 [Fusarium sp. NRRL 66182]|nr:hypothetical protein F66182_16867 [Fusarium sp. NRRL 66182]